MWTLGGRGNARASSGGESRLIRASYGTRRIYSAMVARAAEIWKEYEARWDDRLLFPIGMLRMRSGENEYTKTSVPILRELGLPVEELDGDELARRFPQINPEGLSYGVFERDAGYLLARRGCERVLREFQEAGGSFRRAEAAPGGMDGGRMREIRLSDGGALEADLFVFACGPWLAKLFPEFDPPLVRSTRQEVFYFGPPAGRADLTEAEFPTWIEGPVLRRTGDPLPGLQDRGRPARRRLRPHRR